MSDEERSRDDKPGEDLVADTAAASPQDDGAAVPAQDDVTRAQAGDGPAVPSDDGKSAPARTSFVLAAAFALILAVSAIAMTGFLWWQYRQFYVSLDEADRQTEQSLQRVRANVRGLTDQIGELGEKLQSGGQRVDELQRELDPIPARLADLDQRIDAVQGGSFDARAQWLRAEAEYYLGLANTELQLAHRWQNAIEALGLADDRLRELADPGLAPVRASIAEELIALKAVDLPDIEGLSLSLSGLADSVVDLPLRAQRTANFENGPAPVENVEPGFSRLWQGLKRALSGIIRVERRDEPAPRALTDQEGELIRRQLMIELQLAEVALVRTQAAAFRASLDSAQHLLDRDFDPADAAVDSAKRMLARMRGIDIAPMPPDISESLNRLRAASSEK